MSQPSELEPTPAHSSETAYDLNELAAITSNTADEHGLYLGHLTAEAIAEAINRAGYRKVFDGDCGLSGVKDPDEKEAAEAWMRWANLAMNDEIGAIGAMNRMLTEFGYRKVRE